ncbi:MAG: ABC transporter permease [Pirellulales bacterium]|nr:ABC transporter permease [Pirellulales bacterium]
MTNLSDNPLRLAGRIRGFLLLTIVSLRRALRSRQTAVCALLLAFAALAVVAWSLRHDRDAQEFADDIIFPLYVSFLLPIFSLCYAAPSIAGEHEDQTLVYLLATPLPRPVIFTAKYGSALAAAMLWNFGAWAALSWLAGPAGRILFQPFVPAVFWPTLVYVGLFCAFSAGLRRATIVGLVYVFFLETFLGNVPGIIKRAAISFYTQCLMLDAGTDLGIRPTGVRDPVLFLPLTGDTARMVLATLAVAMFLAGAWLFSRREYV